MSNIINSTTVKQLFVLLMTFTAIWIFSKHYGISNTNEASITCPNCNIILIVIDAARQDHFGVYNYTRNTTPNIDRLATQSFVFENAISQATWTKPSIASLFTSTYPTRHGMDEYSSNNDKGVCGMLPVSLSTLAEQLRKSGYSTHGLINNPMVDSRFGFDKGFDTYQSYQDSILTKNAMNIINDGSNKPFFIYLHYTGPHAPYTPVANFSRMFVGDDSEFIDTQGKQQDYYLKANLSKRQLNYVISQYDGKLAYIDNQIGGIINELDRAGLSKKTILIITSDHGEEFFDHNGEFGHGYEPYDVLINVPLILWVPPAGVHHQIKNQVRLIDLMPTLIDLTTGSIPGGLDGVSIMPILTGNNLSLIGYSELTIKLGNMAYKTLALRTEGWKYMYTPSTGDEKLYYIESDPREINDLSGAIQLKLNFKEDILEYEKSNSYKASVIRNESCNWDYSNKSRSRLYSLEYVI